MRRTKPIQKPPRTAARRVSDTVAPRALSDHAEELMELAVDAAQSRHLPGLLERFAERAARMLSADWCAVMAFRGRETDSYHSSNDKGRPDAARHTSLFRSAKELGKDIVGMPLEENSPDCPSSKS